MSKKNDLYEKLNINKKDRDFCNALCIDIKIVRQKVNAILDSAYTERKSVTMKSKKKIALIAIAATLVLGITSFAANQAVSNWLSSSSPVPDYKSLPTVKQVTKDIGYEPVLINAFKNGYSFKSGNVTENNLTDDSGKSVEKFKAVSFDYEKDGDTVIFAHDKFNSQMGMQGSVVKTVKGVDVYYLRYTNKCVPADYEMSDEDKKAEMNGEIVFSYGSPDVSVQDVQSVTWNKDGMRYQLLQIDGKLLPDELAEMAEEILNK